MSLVPSNSDVSDQLSKIVGLIASQGVKQPEHLDFCLQLCKELTAEFGSKKKSYPISFKKKNTGTQTLDSDKFIFFGSSKSKADASRTPSLTISDAQNKTITETPAPEPAPSQLQLNPAIQSPVFKFGTGSIFYKPPKVNWMLTPPKPEQKPAEAREPEVTGSTRDKNVTAHPNV